MSGLRRVGTMSLNATLRTYLSLASLIWIVVLPILLSLIVSFAMGGEPGVAWTGEWFTYETPRGDRASEEFPKVSKIFGVYLIFAFSALLTRAGAIHDERRRGTLQRTLVAGIPYLEVVAAHVVSLFLVGFIQAIILITVTGMLGTPWLVTGWSSVVLPIVGTIVAAAGIAVGITGLVRGSGLLRIIASGGPSMLALLGGAFFPLDVAPAGVQRLAVINPVYWAMEAFSGGFIYNGLSSQVTPLAVLLLFGVAGMVIGVQGLRRYEP